MKRTIVINLIGGPSAGKSLCAGLLFAELKTRGYITEYIQEYIKHLVWAGDFDTINDQYYISTQQYKLLKSVNGKVDFIVTDGSLFHGLYYNEFYPENVSNVQKTKECILKYMSQFENVYIFLQRGDYVYETEGRLHTEEQAAKISEDLYLMLLNLSLPFKSFKSDVNNIQKMTDWILSTRTTDNTN